MASLAANGHWYPTVITYFIACVLFAWSLYAFSGAGLIGELPFLRLALALISGIYLLRGGMVVPLLVQTSGNLSAFWWWSSLICLAYGIVHLIGLLQIWAKS